MKLKDWIENPIGTTVGRRLGFVRSILVLVSLSHRHQNILDVFIGT